MISYSFSGHETFSLRHGWLKKGIDAVSEKSNFFSNERAMIELGVGKNMVQSIRYWCLATQVVREDSERRGYLKPSDLGKKIFLDGNLDPYIEDSATLWLLHWHLATNRFLSTTWFWMFNHYNYSEFNKEKIASEIQSWLKLKGQKPVSDNTLKRDIDCFLRTYAASRQTKTTVSEDSLDCPLVDLRLIIEVDDGKNYRFNRSSHGTLPDEIFVYSLAKFLEAKDIQPNSIVLSKVLTDAGSPGRVFKLDEDSIVERLEKVEQVSEGAFSYDETAGLKQVYRCGEVDSMRLLEKCYRKASDEK